MQNIHVLKQLVMQKILTPGTAVSPIDGRYASKTAEFSRIFSEMALMRYRLIVEIEYLVFLSKRLSSPRGFTSGEVSAIRKIYTDFSEEDFIAILMHEKTTNHDVKAVEYFIHDKLTGTSLEDVKEFVHIGRTSEDINNLAYALMLREGTEILGEQYDAVKQVISAISEKHEDTPMLAMTHGQPASPTTAGWEMKVFVNRIEKYLYQLRKFSLSVKCNGATGGNNALAVTFPDILWSVFSDHFIDHLVSVGGGNKFSMRFEHNLVTTQIEPHDTYAELFGILSMLNTILLDFSRDMWLYISRGVITQIPVGNEVGSSAMPQKINPINFENAEGNLGMANAMFDHFRNKLPISRMQRDLSDSTVERNFGVAYSYTLIALKAIQAGMKRVYINVDALRAELDDNPEVISEAYQVILRAKGVRGGYEKLKEVVRGKKVTMELLHLFVADLLKAGVIDENTSKMLYNINPHNYIGER